MDKKDNLKGDGLIRQKLAGLDTPPPQTSWQPGQSWEKLQGRLTSEKEAAFRPWPWYYAAAAALLILLIPFAVMLTDIRKQQAQIERLAAQLEKTDGQSASSDRVTIAKPPVKSGPVPAIGKPASLPEKQTGKPAPGTTPAGTLAHRKLPVTKKTPSPDELMAQQPVAAPAHLEEKEPADKAGETILPEETRSTAQAHIVISRPRRKTTSVTLHFPAEEAVRSGSNLAHERENPPQKRPFRVFTRRPDMEELQPAPSGSAVSVLSARLK